ncbi:unnamed protein product, partial [Didymodactylos carnosus]
VIVDPGTILIRPLDPKDIHLRGVKLGDPPVLFLVGSTHEKSGQTQNFHLHLWNNRKCIQVNRSLDKASLAVSLKPFSLDEKTDIDLGKKLFYLKLLSKELDDSHEITCYNDEWIELMCDLTSSIRRSYLFQYYIPLRLLFEIEYNKMLNNLDDIIEKLSLKEIFVLLDRYGSYSYIYHALLNILKLNPFLHQFVMLIKHVDAAADDITASYIQTAKQLASLYLCQFEIFRTHSLFTDIYKAIKNGFETELMDLTPAITLDRWPSCLTPTLDAIERRFGQKLANDLRSLPFYLVSKRSRDGLEHEDGHIEFCYSFSRAETL